MPLVHHDDRDYVEAEKTAFATAEARFHRIIEDGKKTGAMVLSKIIEEHPRDYVVPISRMSFSWERDLLLRVTEETEKVLHDNALGQFCARTEIPLGFIRKLEAKGAEGREQAVNNLNWMARHTDARALVRAVNGSFRGLMSDSYRRLDSRPLVEAFAAACKKTGAVPVGGTHTDLRNTLRAVYPEIFYVDAREPVLIGLEWHNSDFGKGAHELRKFMTRIWCTNLAVRDNVLRQVHLGRRLDENLVFSQRTYELDTMAQSSAIGDIVEGTLSREACEKEVEVLQAAKAIEVDGKGAKAIVKEKLQKHEAERVVELFTTEADTEKVPQGADMYRLSNCVSWLANETENPERRLELQEVAGWLLGR